MSNKTNEVICCTCKYWDGDRKIDKTKNFVETFSQETMGKCICEKASTYNQVVNADCKDGCVEWRPVRI